LHFTAFLCVLSVFLLFSFVCYTILSLIVENIAITTYLHDYRRNGIEPETTKKSENLISESFVV